MLKQILLLASILLLVLTGCEKDPASTSGDVPKKSFKRAIIINEGNWSRSNASLSFYTYEEDTVYNKIFKNANGGKNLGDCANSMVVRDSIGYIVVNGSNTIEKINLNTWKNLGTINLTNGTNPRFMAFVDDNHAYLTNYATGVQIINLEQMQENGSISVGANPEQIVIVNNKAYVANSGWGAGNTVSVISLDNEDVIETIKVGNNPVAIEVDADNELHVLCMGGWAEPDTVAGIYIIDPQADAAIDSLPLSGHPSKLSLDGKGTGYFINGQAIVSYSTKTNEIINNGLMNGNFYNLKADAKSEQIFVSDPKDCEQDGDFLIYDLNGQLISTHRVNIIPGQIVLMYQ